MEVPVDALKVYESRWKVMWMHGKFTGIDGMLSPSRMEC